MKIQIFLAIFILSVFINFVYAQDIPPAPEPNFPVQIVSCVDTDGGLNYSTYGTLTLKKINWEIESSIALPEDNFDYCQTNPNKKQSCEHPEKEILMEAYCIKEEANFLNESIIAFKEYDCTTEGKVCYNGRCINKKDLESDTKYIKEKENCQREKNAIMNFLKKLYSLIRPPAKNLTVVIK
ncbi:MAG: hypothetical protein WCI72_00545 [archaeon]